MEGEIPLYVKGVKVWWCVNEMERDPRGLWDIDCEEVWMEMIESL